MIEKEFNIKLDEYYEKWDQIDVSKILCDKKVMSNIKNENKRQIEIKKRLNGQITKFITTDMLKEIGAFEELRTLFELIQRVSN